MAPRSSSVMPLYSGHGITVWYPFFSQGTRQSLFPAYCLNILINASLLQEPIPVVACGVILAAVTIPIPGNLNSFPPARNFPSMNSPLSPMGVWQSWQLARFTRYFPYSTVLDLSGAGVNFASEGFIRMKRLTGKSALDSATAFSMG